MSDERALCYPTRESFSRQQVAARTGVPDDVLAYWIKQGLLVPLPAEHRAHRRFSYEQLHIAVILNAIRSLGANVGVLRKFSAALQDGFTAIRASGLDEQLLMTAVSLRESLHTFSQGGKVRVQTSPDDWERKGIAGSDTDIVQSWLWSDAREGANLKLAEFGQSLTIQNARSISWALWLTEPSIMMLEGDAGEAWVAWIDSEDDPRIETDNATILSSESGPMAAFYIPAPKLIRRLWPDQLAVSRERSRIRTHNAKVRRMLEWDRTDPDAARRYRERRGIPENWAETFKIIEEDGPMDG